MVIKINTGKFNISMKLLVFITVFNTFFVSLGNKLPYGEKITPLVTAVTILWTLFTVRKRLPLLHILIYGVLALISAFNCLFFNVELSTYVMTYLFCYLPMIIAGGVIDFEENKQYIFRVSCVYLAFLFVYMVFGYSKISTVYSDFIDYMGFAYYALPSLLFVIYHFFEKRDKLSLFFCILGAIYLGICGTRGPILCTGIYLLYCVYCDLRDGSIKRKILIFAAVISGLAVFLNMSQIALLLYPYFQKNGFSTRFLLYFLRKNNKILSLEGRETIKWIVTENINSHFLTGTGLMSDRELFGGSEKLYSHNIFLELVNSFGVPLGFILSGALVLLLVMAFIKATSNTIRNYIMIYFCAAIVKLVVSSSFMQESSVFILIGICIGVLRKKRETDKKLKG